METLYQDLLFSIRQLTQNKTFTLISVTSLALGIGVNVTIFMLINAILLRPLPVKDRSSLVSVFTTFNDGDGYYWTSYPNFRDLRDNASTFSQFAAHSNLQLNFGSPAFGAEEPEQVLGQIVSGNYFDVLGVDTAHGRTFNREEGEIPGAHSVVVISHRLWQRRFGGATDILTREIEINGKKFNVIGVAPEGFHGLLNNYPADVFISDMMWQHVVTGTFRDLFELRRVGTFDIVGRMNPDITLAQASVELENLGREFERQYPDDNKDKGLTLLPLDKTLIRPSRRGNYVLGSTLLMAAAALVLLIACGNLANLLLGRLISRRKEIAIRISVGASRLRLVRMLLTESVFLAFLGGAAGLALAYWMRHLAWVLKPPRVPDSLELAFDLRVLLFSFTITLLTGVLFGLAPMFQSFKTDLITGLKNAVTKPNRLGKNWNLRNILTTLQTAVAFVSLVAGALFLRSYWKAQEMDIGFEKENLFVFSIDPNALGYDNERSLVFFRQMAEQVGTVPGVESAAVAETLKLYPAGGYLLSNISIAGQDADKVYLTHTNTIGAGYFETMDIPIEQGRDFTPFDIAENPSVAIVNQAMAERYWPNQDAIGKQFVYASTQEVAEIIGVVANTRYKSIDEEPFPYIYRAISQNFASPVFVHVRTASTPRSTIKAVQQEVRRMEPRLALAQVRTISDVIHDALWASRLAAVLLFAFGCLALLLTVVGLYGTLSYALNLRRREIGVRMALGADSLRVMSLLMRQGIVLLGAAILIGLLITIISIRKAEGFLMGLSSLDPLSLGGAGLVLVAVVLCANLVVALKATRVQPLKELRQE